MRACAWSIVSRPEKVLKSPGRELHLFLAALLMRHLLVLAHPNPESFCSAVAQTLKSTLESQNHSVELRDLYRPLFQPTLQLQELQSSLDDPELLAERDSILWADHLIFVFPVWWYDRPALLKGWIDRVFSYGFAYTVEQGRGRGLLAPRKASVVATFGSAREDVESLSPEAVDWVMGAMLQGTLGYCGLEPVGRYPLFAVGKLEQNQGQELLQELASSVLASLKVLDRSSAHTDGCSETSSQSSESGSA